MNYRKKYSPFLSGTETPAVKHNPLQTGAGYFDRFDERVFQNIAKRRRQHRSRVMTLTATAAAITGFAFWFFIAKPTESPVKIAVLSSDSVSHLTGSYLTDQILADEIIDMAAGIDTLFLSDGELWTDVGLKEIPDESIAEYLFFEGVSTTEIAMAEK